MSAEESTLAFSQNKVMMDNLKIKISERDLMKIPDVGPFISVSNRPIGIIEEYLLEIALGDKRKDLQFLNNAYLKEDSSFYEEKMEQNNLYTLTDKENSSKATSIFPVGNISSFQNEEYSFTDSKWDKAIVKELYKCQIPIIPIYIHLENKNIFKVLSTLSPSLYTKDLLIDLIAKKGLEISISIGKAIHSNHYQFRNAHHFGQFVRAKLYGLKSKLQVDLFYQEAEVKDLISPMEPQLLSQELESISDTNKIASQGDFDLYLAKAKKIPLTIQEIGRLREETFRDIGEGTNQDIDLDEYDLHYLHLFLFDRVNNRIAGAYRIGDGSYIMKTLGKKGFYINSLFKIKKGFNSKLQKSIELGRSFVSLSYQNHRLPLYLLWCGILNYLKSHPNIKYMIGPVSISNSYSHASKSIIVKYIKKYHWDEQLAKNISPKMPYYPSYDELDSEILVDCTQSKIKLLDHIIEDIDPKHTRVPVLLKKYFAQNAKIIGFNVDPNFNEALDGFIITKVDELPNENYNLFTFNKIDRNASELS